MKQTKNQLGLTLVELLAAVIILGIVMTLATSIFISANEEDKKQQQENASIKEVSYTLKLLTKDFRKGTQFSSATNTLAYANPQDQATTVRYTFANNEIVRMQFDASNQQLSSEVVVKGIKQFLVCEEPISPSSTSCPPVNQPDSSYHIYIETLAGEVKETDIIIRSGSL